jgi:hypothetical protein
MKIAVLSYSGNVGKSLLSQHLLRPRIADAKMFYIESINAGGGDTQVSGGDFSSVMREVNICDNAIVDIGSSNIEKVLARVQAMKGVLEDFDYFLIPVIAKSKQENDTVRLIAHLDELGVGPEKIKVVCNQVEPGVDASKLFTTLSPLLKSLGINWAQVHKSETYALLGSSTIRNSTAVGFDFKAAIQKTGDPAAKRDLSSRQIIARLARGTDAELDGVFGRLFPAEAVVAKK